MKPRFMVTLDMLKSLQKMVQIMTRPASVCASIRIGAAGKMLAIAVLGGFGVQSGAAASPVQSEWIGDPTMAEARLISAVTNVGQLSALPLGLEIRTAPGWKVYWRTPGEAGLPPTLDFGNSPYPDLKAEISWPAPRRFDVFGFDNFGYQDQVILPLSVTGHDVGGFTQIVAELELLTCSDICVPVFGTLNLDVPAGDAAASTHARAIAEYSAAVPRMASIDANDDLGAGRSPSGPSLAVLGAVYGDGELVIELASGAPPIDDIFVEGFEHTAFKAPVMEGNFAIIPYVTSPKHEFTGGNGRVTIIAAPQSGDFPITITPASASSGGRTGPDTLLGISFVVIGIAFLGGLILNLMPCVLPVLAIKLSTVLNVAGAAQSEIRWRFLIGAAGIMTSFMILAGGLTLARAAGASIGWGVQFQNAYFIGAMILFLGIFAANILGLFTLRTPAFAQSIPLPSGNSRLGRYGGDFLSGMLATILATPCSAPFVGTAVTAAFAGSASTLFAIFAAMGLGLAAPWILVAIVPSAVSLLPKPGAWFRWVKRGLAAALVGTMIWLASILVTLVSPANNDQAENWQAWRPGAVAAIVDQGKVAFVDVTADWCVTCKANKALVLDQSPVADVMAKAVAAGDLVMLSADWTRPDPDISAFLARHDRFGIPFNIVYGPAFPDGILLPELLSSEAVLTALEKLQIKTN